MRSLFAHPLVHFVVLGGGLWAAGRWSRPMSPPAVPAAFSALRTEWTATAGRPPTASEEAALRRRATDEDILVNAAVALGLDRAPAVRDRLTRLMQFVATDAGEDPGALERAARALGLDRDDVVVRRHLGVLMHLALARVDDGDLPDDQALQDYLEAHPDRFREPAQFRLVQAFLPATRPRVEAERLRASLASVAPAAPMAVAAGEPFVHGRTLAGSGPEIDRLMGSGFAAGLVDAPVGMWSGPLRSAYGWHVVWVVERQPARLPALATVRSRVLQAVLRERGAAQAEVRMAALRTWSLAKNSLTSRTR